MLVLNTALLTQPAYQQPVERVLAFLMHTCGYDRRDACALLIACQGGSPALVYITKACLAGLRTVQQWGSCCELQFVSAVKLLV